MNLRVDLILPTEQRSASVVSAKSLVRIAIIVAPLCLIVLIAMVIVGMMKVSSEASNLEAIWKDTEPKLAAVRALRQEAGEKDIIRRKIDGWPKANLSWADQMHAIQKRFPAEIKVRLLRMSMSSSMVLIDNGTPGREFAVSFSGVAYGDRSEMNIQDLRKSLLQASAPTGMIESVDVTRFAASSGASAGKDDRDFQIEIKYKSRKAE